MTKPDFLKVAVEGGDLTVARWGRGERTLLAIHGITASSMSIAPLASEVEPGWTVLAPDLRGRGASSELPGPFGMRTHAADCARVLEALGGSRPAVVVGESMGAFVAVVLAAARPDLVERLVLVDGGLPLPLPPGIDPDALIAAILGPALARLSQTFESREAYREFWRTHPALVGHWSPDIEAYVDYDLVGTEPELRSRVSEEATLADGGEGFRDPDLIPDALRALTLPIHLLRAERNLANQTPALYPDDAIAVWQAELPQLVDEVVEDTNHYTIVFGKRGAALIAARACSTSGQMVPVNPVGESN